MSKVTIEKVYGGYMVFRDGEPVGGSRRGAWSKSEAAEIAKEIRREERLSKRSNPKRGKVCTLRNMALVTIKRLPGGAVAITGTKMGDVGRRNPSGLWYGVVPRFGFARGTAKVYSAHATKAAAIKAAKREGGRQNGAWGCMVVKSSDGFSKGERFYMDTADKIFPVVW